MLLVYISLTGNVRNFVERVGMDSLELNPSISLKEVNQDYIIVIPTYVGYVNEEAEEFIEYKDNKKHLVGFASSGNLNFNNLFCINGKEMSEKYGKPLLFKFEYSGTDKDIEDFKKEVYTIEISRAK